MFGRIDTIDDLQTRLSESNVDHDGRSNWELIKANQDVIKNWGDVEKIQPWVDPKYMPQFMMAHEDKINNFSVFERWMEGVRGVPEKDVFPVIKKHINLISNLEELSALLMCYAPKAFWRYNLDKVKSALTPQELAIALTAVFPYLSFSYGLELASCCKEAGLVHEGKEQQVKEIRRIDSEIHKELDVAMREFRERHGVTEETIGKMSSADQARYQVLKDLYNKVIDITNEIRNSITDDWQARYQAQLGAAVSASGKRLDKYTGFEKFFITVLNIISTITVIPAVVKYAATGSLFYSTVGKPKEAVDKVQKLVDEVPPPKKDR